jgi:hypothetical protein
VSQASVARIESGGRVHLHSSSVQKVTRALGAAPLSILDERQNEALNEEIATWAG